jgi:hypothetical protein
MDPRTLSFEQREGLAPLPSQLQRGELSRELRAMLWAYVYNSMHAQEQAIYGRYGQWVDILLAIHLERNHLRVDKFEPFQIYQRLGDLFEKGEYAKVYGWLDFVMRYPKAPKTFGDDVGLILTECRSAYRVIDGMIVAMASDEERKAFEQALTDTDGSQFSGARFHLRQSGTHLTDGKFADSIRESISAVESVARVLEPSGEFSKALAKLETRISIHAALKKGFSSLYGYTSDEGGIRHALLDSGQAAVDEVDAVFFLGACASFVSYLIGKSNGAGIT